MYGPQLLQLQLAEDWIVDTCKRGSEPVMGPSTNHSTSLSETYFVIQTFKSRNNCFPVLSLDPSWTSQ